MHSDVYAGPLSVAMERFGISTPACQAAFIAQIAEESQGLTRIQENLNYSVQALRVVWPDHFSPAIASTYARQPAKIANRAYANRMGNGDEASGDGWTFRGRGLIQITGRSMYLRCGAELGLPLVEQPDLLLVPANAAMSATWFWHENNLNAFADSGDFTEITKRINGGLSGLADRIAFWNRAKAAFGVAP